jgi:hypothetical protein
MSDSEDESWVIHYSVAFTWPIIDLGDSPDEEPLFQGKKQKTAVAQAFEYSSKCRQWNDPKLVGARNNPRWYFQCLLAFLNTHKNHMFEVKFSVWLHGKLQVHDEQLRRLLVKAAKPSVVTINYCPVEYPWQFPMSARMIPVIDSTDNNELVVVLDVHDDLERQRQQVGYFLNVVMGETGLTYDGILTFWPVESDGFASLTRSKGSDDYKTVNAVPVARATSPKDGVVAKYLPAVKKIVDWWYVDAGLIITNNTARDALRKVYQSITFSDHLDRIVAKTNYAADWWSANNKAATDEMSLSQYLLAFQPQRDPSGFLGQWFDAAFNPAVHAMWTTVVSTFGPYVHALGERKVDPERESGGVIAPETLEPIDYKEWKLLNDTRKLDKKNQFIITGEHAKTSVAAQSLPFEVAIEARLEWSRVAKAEQRGALLEKYTSALFKP